MSTDDRPCRKPGCRRGAQHTVTLDYRAKVVAVGRLSPEFDPTALDLCDPHASEFRSPQGWSLVRYREPTEER